MPDTGSWSPIFLLKRSLTGKARVIAGHKSVLAKDNVSPEAKAHSKDILENQYGVTVYEDNTAVDTLSSKDSHVVRGLKASISNPRKPSLQPRNHDLLADVDIGVSDNARDHSKQVLEQKYGIEVVETNSDATEENKDPARV